MIGRDYSRFGEKRYIIARFGDGIGYPFKGPTDVRFLDRRILSVVDAEKNLHYQNILGPIENSLCTKESSLAKSNENSRSQDLDDDKDDWQSKILEKYEKGSKKQTEHFKWKITVVDFAIKCASFLPLSQSALIGDSRNVISIVNKADYSFERSICGTGSEPGQISMMTGIDSFRLGFQVIICVCEAGANQRVQLLDMDGKCLTWIGGYGPAIGQFREPSSISCHNGFSMMSNSEIHDSFSPDWFRGVASVHELEDLIYEEPFVGNFYVGQREAEPFAFDVVYMAQNMRPVRLVIQSTLPEVESDDHSVSSLESEQPVSRKYFLASTIGESNLRNSVWDVVKSMRHLKKSNDRRPFVEIAVADRENFRVQIFRYFWTESEIYCPSLEIFHVIGGSKNLHYKLADPVSVSYSSTGELAVCDVGLRSVLIFSPYMDVIKIISIPFLDELECRRAAQMVGVTLSNFVSSKYGDGCHRFQDPMNVSLVNSKPCSVSFSHDGQLAVAYRSGGIVIHRAFRSFPMGDLDVLPECSLHRIIDFLDYSTVIQLRNTCRYLHNFTKKRRFRWNLYPLRGSKFKEVYYLYWKYSHLANGEQNYDGVFPIVDSQQKLICSSHLLGECQGLHCEGSHEEPNFLLEDVSLSQMRLEYPAFFIIGSRIFGPIYMWQYERYIEELFQGYATLQVNDVRLEVHKKNVNMAHRTIVKEEIFVISISSYLEIMTFLEENFCGAQDIHSHPLFAKRSRDRYTQQVDYSADYIASKLYPDPLEQYSRGIDVPYLRNKNRRFLPVGKMEKEVRGAEASEKELHIQAFRHQADKAESLIHKLFS